MQLKPTLEEAVRYLEENAVGSSRMNAEVLLMFTLSCDRAYLYAHSERELTPDEIARYHEALAERARGVPSQYIVGHQEFWGLDLIVSPAVLIPRPETEHVVEAVLELARDYLVRSRPAGDANPLRIVDVGTGSGAIALALAYEFSPQHAQSRRSIEHHLVGGPELSQPEIWACDISAAALEIARLNAARLELDARVRFVESDLLDAFDPAMQFDFVVSNPPYVGHGEEDKVQREVKKFEPRIAVFAGPDGLDTIRRLIPQAHARLRPAGWLLIEIGYTQEAAVRTLLQAHGGWRALRSIPDLQGIPRVIAAQT